MCAWYPRRLESGIKSLGTGVAGVSYHMGVGSRQEQQALSHLSSPNVKHLTLKMLAKASTLVRGYAYTDTPHTTGSHRKTLNVYLIQLPSQAVLAHTFIPHTWVAEAG